MRSILVLFFLSGTVFSQGYCFNPSNYYFEGDCPPPVYSVQPLQPTPIKQTWPSPPVQSAPTLPPTRPDNVAIDIEKLNYLVNQVDDALTKLEKQVAVLEKDMATTKQCLKEQDEATSDILKALNSLPPTSTPYDDSKLKNAFLQMKQRQDIFENTTLQMVNSKFEMISSSLDALRNLKYKFRILAPDGSVLREKELGLGDPIELRPVPTIPLPPKDDGSE